MRILNADFISKKYERFLLKGESAFKIRIALNYFTI